MRHPYQAQPDLQLTPIEKIRLPLKSRDELPPNRGVTTKKCLAIKRCGTTSPCSSKIP